MISNIETNLGKSVVPMILGGYIDFQKILQDEAAASVCGSRSNWDRFSSRQYAL